MYGGFRIGHPLNAVATVTIKTLGRVGITQGVYLSMVGLGVGLQALGVAAAAVFGDRQFGGVIRRICDVVCAMAIGANRSGRIPVIQHRSAVHRGRVLFALLGVTLAAGVRDA